MAVCIEGNTRVSENTLDNNKLCHKLREEATINIIDTVVGPRQCPGGFWLNHEIIREKRNAREEYAVNTEQTAKRYRSSAICSCSRNSHLKLSTLMHNQLFGGPFPRLDAVSSSAMVGEDMRSNARTKA